MVDPKVVGGGVAVVAIGGGTGYAISNATSSKTESSTTENTAPSKPKTIGAKMEEAKFTTSTEETACKGKKGEEYSSTKYRETIAACYKTKKLSDRATELTLELISVDSTNEQETKAKWEGERKEDIKTIISDLNGKSNWESSMKETIQTNCKTTLNKDISSGITDDDWQKYLKVCIKDGSGAENKLTEALTRKFWTNTTQDLT